MVIPVYVRRGIMNVQRVSNNGISGNFYIFNNSNYRQIDKTAVTPVKPVKKLPGFTGRGDNCRSPAAGCGIQAGENARGFRYKADRFYKGWICIF